MATLTRDRAVTFKTAGWLKRVLRVDDSILLRLVALEQVRVQKTSMFPRYCVEDVQTYLEKDHRCAGNMQTTKPK